MNILFDKYNRQEAPSLFLCTPELRIVSALGQATDIKNTLRYTSISELEFNYPQSINNGKTILEVYDKIKNKMVVLVDGVGYFRIIKSPEDTSGKVPVKKISAQSIEVNLINARLSGFSGTFKFYDFNEPDGTLLQIMANKIPDWQITYIDPDVIDLYRTFDIGNNTIYNFLTSDVSKAYSCIFLFDYLNKGISVYAIENISTSTNIRLSSNNILKTMTLDEQSDELATVLYCYGGGNLTIRAVNPLGTNAIYNFDYFKTSDWMQEDLIEALDNWEDAQSLFQETYVSEVGIKTQFIGELVEEESTLETMENVLDAYITEYEAKLAGDFTESEIEKARQAVEAQKVAISIKKRDIWKIKTYINDSDKNLRRIVNKLKFTGQISWQDFYDDVFSLYNNLQKLISDASGIYYSGSPEPQFDSGLYEDSIREIRESYNLALESVLKLSDYIKDGVTNYWTLSESDIGVVYDLIIESVDYIEALHELYFAVIPYTPTTNTLEEYISLLESYTKIIYYKTNFTFDQFQRLQSFIFENTYTNDNIITTDNMTEEEVQNQALELYNKSVIMLERISQPRYEFKGDIVNFLELIEYEELINEIDLGKFITIELSNGNEIEVYLLELVYSYDKPGSSTMVFSNKIKLNSSSFRLAEFLLDGTKGTSGVPGITGNAGASVQTTNVKSGSSVSGNNLLKNDNSIINKDGYISFGETPPTKFGNFPGAWLGYESSPKMSLYTNEDNYFKYDGKKILIKALNFILDSNGNITATSASLSGKISADEGDVGGWIIQSDSLSSGSITLDSSTPAILMGNATDYGVGEGVFIGKDSSDDLYKLHIGDPSNDYFFYDGISSLQTGGDWLAGWTINETSLTSGSGPNFVSINSTGGSTPAFSSGSVNIYEAPFRVYQDGSLIATSASISGSITATSGLIGNWYIDSGSLVSENRLVWINSTGSYAFYANDTFYVTHEGELYASNAYVTGSITANTIEATTGSIAGWIISASSLFTGSGNETVYIDSGGSNPAFSAGAEDANTAPFQVLMDGSLIATSASISGSIIAISGSIGNWKLDSGSLVSQNGQVHINATGSYAFYANDTFYVNHDGELYATSADISGSIVAEEGNIGGWQIESNSLISPDRNVWINSSGSYSFYANDTFYVTPEGKIYATSGSIGGNILSEDSISSPDFSSGTLGTGWRITSQGEAEFQNIRARGIIKTSVFEKDTISAINGVVIISKSDILENDMSALDSATVTVSGSGTVFVVDEIVRIKDGTDDEWMLITSASSAPTYGVTRDLAGDYSSDGNPEWKAGTALVSMGSGASGSETGFIMMDSSASASPYIDIYGRNSGSYLDYTLHGRFGYLAGITDSDVGLNNSDVWGFYTDNAYLKGTIVSTSGSIGGWEISNNTISSGEITLNSSSNSILLGSATDYNSGTGIFMGEDSDIYKLRIGNPDGSRFVWDGGALRFIDSQIQISGSVSSISIGNTPPTSASSGTGLWISREGLFGLSGSSVQIKIDDEGVLRTGEDNVVIDGQGIQIKGGQSALIFSSASTGDTLGSLDIKTQSGETFMSLLYLDTSDSSNLISGSSFETDADMGNWSIVEGEAYNTDEVGGYSGGSSLALKNYTLSKTSVISSACSVLSVGEGYEFHSYKSDFGLNTRILLYNEFGEFQRTVPSQGISADSGEFILKDYGAFFAGSNENYAKVSLSINENEKNNFSERMAYSLGGSGSISPLEDTLPYTYYVKSIAKDSSDNIYFGGYALASSNHVVEIYDSSASSFVDYSTTNSPNGNISGNTSLAVSSDGTIYSPVGIGGGMGIKLSPERDVWKGIAGGGAYGSTSTPYISDMFFDISGSLIISGSFSGFNTSTDGVTITARPASNVIRINTSSSTTNNLGGGINNVVYCGAVDSNGYLYFGGSFTEAGGTSCSSIARYDISTGSYSCLDEGVSGTIYAIDIDSQDNVYIYGNFSVETLAGTKQHVAKWSSSGSYWEGLGTGLSQAVFYNEFTHIYVDNNNDVYFSGYHTTTGSLPSDRLAKWNASASSMSIFQRGISSPVSMTEDSGGNIYFGGSDSAGKESQYYVTDISLKETQISSRILVGENNISLYSDDILLESQGKVNISSEVSNIVLSSESLLISGSSVFSGSIVASGSLTVEGDFIASGSSTFEEYSLFQGNAQVGRGASRLFLTDAVAFFDGYSFTLDDINKNSLNILSTASATSSGSSEAGLSFVSTDFDSMSIGLDYDTIESEYALSVFGSSGSIAMFNNDGKAYLSNDIIVGGDVRIYSNEGYYALLRHGLSSSNRIFEFPDYGGTLAVGTEFENWTPTYSFIAPAPTDYSTLLARYIIINDFIAFTIRMSVITRGSSTGNQVEFSLPATARNALMPFYGYETLAQVTPTQSTVIMSDTSTARIYLNGAMSRNGYFTVNGFYEANT